MNLTIKATCVYMTMHQWHNDKPAGARQTIRPGATVEYVAHVLGGMVKVRHDGRDVVIHPGATEELE